MLNDTETAAVEAFVADAAKATPEQRKMVAEKMRRNFTRPNGERPVFNGRALSLDAVLETIRRLEAN